MFYYDFCFTAVAQENFKCPDDFGFYPHHKSCDKYWKCDNGVAELKTCGNGLAFDASDSKFLTENCDYIHNVDCGDRHELGKYYHKIIKTVLYFLLFFQNHQSLLLIALVCTVSSLMRLNAMSSGTVGMVKLLVTNVLPVLHTTEKPVYVCGLIKFQNVNTKVITPTRNL